ncbi:MAG: class I SAM-dependent methyltransferase [Chlorobi bacterium]|nr:class I SAM-dependent methyltransferase [Chlorobiota bacterium]MCI0716360.1 class I SAM-dependent methyltransferase [Chlorobiota bacterium]
MNDRWNNAELYESYVGRWSSLVSAKFLKWMNVGNGLVWLDVGCGTGALTKAILNSQNTRKVISIDPSEYHINFCREFIPDSKAEYYLSGAEKIPLEDKTVDVIVSGLVLNFIPNIKPAMSEFKRAAKDNAVIGAYVWDYSGEWK